MQLRSPSFHRVLPSELTEGDLEALDRLRLRRPDSDMAILLASLRSRGSAMNGAARIVVAKEEDRIIGWAFVESWSTGRMKAPVAVLGVYVLPSRRHRGVGSALASRIISVHREVVDGLPEDMDPIFLRSGA